MGFNLIDSILFIAQTGYTTAFCLWQVHALAMATEGKWHWFNFIKLFIY